MQSKEVILIVWICSLFSLQRLRLYQIIKWLREHEIISFEVGKM